MKKRFSVSILFLCLVFSFMIPGFVAFADQSKDNVKGDDVSDKYLIPLLTALKNKDNKLMYELWIEQPVTEENDEFFEQFFTQWNGRVWSSIEAKGKKKRAADGPAPSAVEYYYLVTCGREEIDFAFAISDTSKKIDWIKINCDAQQITGTIDTWRQFNFAQWLFAGVAIAELVFSLYIAVICIRNRNRLWGLWLIFIIFAYAGIAFPTKGDLIVSFYVYLFAFPKIIIIQDWGAMVYISFPIGAVVYYLILIRKKKLLYEKKPE